MRPHENTRPLFRWKMGQLLLGPGDVREELSDMSGCFVCLWPSEPVRDSGAEGKILESHPGMCPARRLHTRVSNSFGQSFVACQKRRQLFEPPEPARSII